jgi:alpha-1,2-rhamnosyltransferase
MFKLKTKDTDFFIQQHVDPIEVHPKTRHLVRLHDILPLTHPFFFTEKARGAFTSGIARLLTDHKIIWIMDTQASAKVFLENFGNQYKVEVVPCEVGYGINPEEAFNITKHKIANIDKNVYLCVNTIEPRKNTKLVIESFLNSLKQADKKINDELIIVGKYGWLESELIFKLRSGFYGHQVKFFEDASDSQLQDLYKSADFVISASEAEGFGLPPLEGMLFGCLPIVSDIPQHRETMGGFAAYFELNVASLTEHISKSREVSEPNGGKMRLAAHNHVRNNYSGEVLTKQWNELLNQLT